MLPILSCGRNALPSKCQVDRIVEFLPEGLHISLFVAKLDPSAAASTDHNRLCDDLAEDNPNRVRASWARDFLVDLHDPARQVYRHGSSMSQGHGHDTWKVTWLGTLARLARQVLLPMIMLRDWVGAGEAALGSMEKVNVQHEAGGSISCLKARRVCERFRIGGDEIGDGMLRDGRNVNILGTSARSESCP